LVPALHGEVYMDTGDLMWAMIESDATLTGGANESVIRDVFTARGIDENLDLGFRGIGYVGC
jgi:hypothetical protein